MGWMRHGCEHHSTLILMESIQTALSRSSRILRRGFQSGHLVSEEPDEQVSLWTVTRSPLDIMAVESYQNIISHMQNTTIIQFQSSTSKPFLAHRQISQRERDALQQHPPSQQREVLLQRPLYKGTGLDPIVRRQ